MGTDSFVENMNDMLVGDIVEHIGLDVVEPMLQFGTYTFEQWIVDRIQILDEKGDLLETVIETSNSWEEPFEKECALGMQQLHTHWCSLCRLTDETSDTHTATQLGYMICVCFQQVALRNIGGLDLVVTQPELERVQPAAQKPPHVVQHVIAPTYHACYEDERTVHMVESLTPWQYATAAVARRISGRQKCQPPGIVTPSIDKALRGLL